MKMGEMIFLGIWRNQNDDRDVYLIDLGEQMN